MKQKQYTIQELSELTGFSRRTIRYYIQEGLLEPPAGRGRGGYYYDSHLQLLSKIRGLQRQGLNLSSIAQILREAEAETLDTIKINIEKKSLLSKFHCEVIAEAIPEETPQSPSRQVWIQYPLADGIALNVRRDIDIQQRKKIDQILRLADALINTSAKGEGSHD